MPKLRQIHLDIFGFDLTMTSDERVEVGSKLKEVLNKYFKHDNSKRIAAIATFNNNPEYIRESVEKILGERVTCSEIQKMGPQNLHELRVSDTRNPIILSCLSGGIETRDANIRQLGNNKNIQINAIRNYYEHKYDIQSIHFFDDDTNNFKKAREILDVTCHLVVGNGVERKFSLKENYPPIISCKLVVKINQTIEELKKELEKPLMKIPFIRKPTIEDVKKELKCRSGCERYKLMVRLLFLELLLMENSVKGRDLLLEGCKPIVTEGLFKRESTSEQIDSTSELIDLTSELIKELKIEACVPSI